MTTLTIPQKDTPSIPAEESKSTSLFTPLCGPTAALFGGVAICTWAGPVSNGGPLEAVVLGAIALALTVVGGLRSGQLLRSLASSAAFAATFASVVWLAIPTWFVVHAMPEWLAASVAAIWQVFGHEVVPLGGGIYSVAHATGWADISMNVEKFGHGVLLALAMWTIYAAAQMPVSFTRRIAFVTGAAAIVFVGSSLRVLLAMKFDLAFNAISAYWLPWFEAASAAPIAIAIGFLARAMAAGATKPATAPHRSWHLAVAAACAAAAAGAAVWFDPPGQPRAGTVLIADAKSDWAWAGDDFGPESFGERKVYTYGSVRQLLSRYWPVELHAEGEITPEALADVSVLVVKMPTRAYTAREMDAIETFVQGGGGLWLIGDHTNLFGSATFLNPLASRFGLVFGDDGQFDAKTGGPTGMEASLASRSLLWTRGVDHLQQMTFLTGCTVEAPAGRGTMIGTGMGSEPVDYSHVNFFGDIKLSRDERWGAFVQMANVTHGKGRVIAFTDSTVFSDFCLWDDAKAALAVETVNLLNRERPEAVAAGVSTLHAACVPLGIAAFVLGALAVARTPWSALGFCAATAFATVLFGGVSRAEPAVPAKALEHVRIHQDLSYASFPSFLQWDPAAVTNPLAFDQFGLCWARIGVVPLRNRALHVDKDPNAEVLILPNPDVVTPEMVGGFAERVRKGGSLLVLTESTIPSQRVMIERLLGALGLKARGVGVPAPKWPVAPGVTQDPIVTDAYVRTEIERVEDIFVLPNSTIWIQRCKVGGGELIFVDGGLAFSRRVVGMAFTDPEGLQLEMCRLMMALGRYTLGQPTGKESLVEAARQVERLWPKHDAAAENAVQPGPANESSQHTHK